MRPPYARRHRRHGRIRLVRNPWSGTLVGGGVSERPKERARKREVHASVVQSHRHRHMRCPGVATGAFSWVSGEGVQGTEAIVRRRSTRADVGVPPPPPRPPPLRR